MSGVKRVGTLEINEDMDYQRRMWAIQRVGWVVFVLIMVAALLGLFGRGPLSAASVESGGMQLRYERFVRLLAPMTLEVELPSQGAEQKEARFWVSSGYLQGLAVENISPEPRDVILSGEGQMYVFDVEQPGEMMLVTINAKPEQWGSHPGEIGADAGTATQFSQFVYP